jgi:hypothetical protein
VTGFGTAELRTVHRGSPATTSAVTVVDWASANGSTKPSL